MKANHSKQRFSDKLIGWFSPQMALKRVQAREKLQRKYEGATETRRTVGWNTSNSSSQKETYQSLEKLRDRSRDLLRNNAYAKRAQESFKNNVVGKGILAQITDVSSSAREKKINDLWDSWAGSTECDFDQRKNFIGIQRLIERSRFENGEVLILRRYLKNSDFKTIPLALQLIESDHLDTSGFYSSPNKGNKLVQGIEFDPNGKRVAYHLFKEHPGGFSTSRETVRIDASEMLHVYDELRVGQVRGVADLSPTLIKLKDFDEYEDAQLVRQKMAACYMAFVRDQDMPEDGELSDDEEDLITKFEPGIIEMLPEGKTIEFATPPSVDGYADYARHNLRGIACAIGLSYESLSMDYSNVNFSSGRMGWIEMARTIDDIRHNVLIPQFLNPVFEWFLEAVSLIGLPTSSISVTWTPPKREMIDPTKETPALIESIQSGLVSFSEAIQSLGKDPDQHIARIKKDFEDLDKAGLRLTCDPRYAVKASSPQDQSGG